MCHPVGWREREREKGRERERERERKGARGREGEREEGWERKREGREKHHAITLHQAIIIDYDVSPLTANRNRRQDFPTPESPIRSNLNK